MRRRWRVFRSNPDANRILALIAAALAGALGFTAAWSRDELERGTAAHSATSLIVIAAVLLVVVSGVLEGRYADALAEIWPAKMRRGGLLRLLGGLSLSLAGCVVATALNDDATPGWVIAMANAGLFVGLAIGLGGAARLLMSDGARYAARKLQERLDDDL